MVASRRKMAGRRVVIAAVAQAVSELQSNEADSDEQLNEVLTHLTDCCQSSSSVTNIVQELASELGSGTAIKHYAEATVSSYTPSEFHQHFRMGRECFEKLVNEVGKRLQREAASASQVPVQTKVLLTVWTLSNQETFRQIGDRFDLDRGNAHAHYVQICNVLHALRQEYIKWPSTPADITAVSSGFRFPFTIGAIDGSHVQIKAPLPKLDSYTNRKSFTSVVLQGVCDSSMRFTDISVGWPGSMHDARIFRLSAVGKRLSAQGIDPYHLLGDSAYPLLPYMIVPFRDNGHLTADEKTFNILHSSSRTVIERAFARLKGKFRRLKYLDMNDMALVTLVITAACVLHNFTLMHEASVDEDVTDDADDVNFASDPASSEQQQDVPSGNALERRHELMMMLL